MDFYFRRLVSERSLFPNRHWLAGMPRSLFDLPQELLAEILCFCVFEEQNRISNNLEIFSGTSSPDFTDIYRRYASCYPWTLAHICRDLRHISLSLPWIWSRIAVIASNSPNRQLTPYEKLEAQIKRTGSHHKLSIALFVRSPRRFTATKPEHKLLQLLVSTSPRWEVVNMFDNTTTMFNLLSNQPNPLPNLQSLTVLWPGRPQQVALSLIFHNLPRLKYLCVDGAEARGLFNPDLTRVTLFHTVAPSQDTLRITLSELIQRAPQLKELEILSPVPFAFSSSGSISINTLTSLSLTCVSGLLERLNLPALASLRIPWMEQLGTGLLDFLRRSSCRLELLVIAPHGDEWDGFNAEEYTELKRLVPSLVSLDLGGARFYRERLWPLGRLSRDATKPDLFPVLKTLSGILLHVNDDNEAGRTWECQLKSIRPDLDLHITRVYTSR